jgi:hypothetical protein
MPAADTLKAFWRGGNILYFNQRVSKNFPVIEGVRRRGVIGVLSRHVIFLDNIEGQKDTWDEYFN